MSWCDKLASTPAVGVRLDKLFAPVSSLLDPLTPIVSTWVDAESDHPAFAVDQQDPFHAVLQTFDGYSYMLGSEWFTVEFKHRLRFKHKSAGPPVAELTSKPLPYTELLSQVTAKMLRMVELVTAGKARKLQRIGIVSTTAVDKEDVPPGLARFIKYVSKPWDTVPDAYNIEITTKLPKGKGSSYQDRCIHVISKPEDDEALVTVRLDYQRIFGDPRGLSMASLPGQIDDAKNAALDYFEDLGQGERFDG